MRHIIKRFDEQSEIFLKTIGQIVFDYLKIIESGNLDLAKKYLMEWTGGDIKIVWDGQSYVPAIITTLNRFITPASKEYQRKKGYDVIEITKKLLDEIKHQK